MNIVFDPKADAVNIVFNKGKVAETREVGREMYLDVDKNGDPLSLEILGVSERFDLPDPNAFTFTVSRSAP